MIQKKADHHGDHAPQEIPLGDGEHGVKNSELHGFCQRLFSVSSVLSVVKS